MINFKDIVRKSLALVLIVGNAEKREASFQYEVDNCKMNQEYLGIMFEFVFSKMTKSHSKSG